MEIPVITGPTGVGKTDISIYLSSKFDIEILSADAFQVYKYMDIGTSKPDNEILSKYKHHLIDILEPDQFYSAGIFFEESEKILYDIITRLKLPLIVGGTGFYIETLVKGIFNDKPFDKDLRERLYKSGKVDGFKDLYNCLQNIDREYAVKISPNDHMRIVRALEVYEKTGIPFSKAHKLLHKKPQFSYKVFIVNKERKLLYDDIDSRVDEMFEKGWVKEVENLLKKGYNESMHSFKAIGYRQIVDFLMGKYNIYALKDEIRKKTRNFAKRQLTYFKHLEFVTNVFDRALIAEYFDTYYREYKF